jgi:aerobic C4-dicarboxylate transport protein
MSSDFFGKLYVQVLIGVVAGGLLGYLYPEIRHRPETLGDVFIRLIKMVFAPVIFAMVVLGIAKMESMKELGRVGARALIYFEVLSTFALLLGLIVVNVFQTGRRHERRRQTLDTKSDQPTTRRPPAKSTGFVDFLLNMVPTSVVDALAKNDILQILVFATMFGIALSHMGRAPSRWSTCWKPSATACSSWSAWSCASRRSPPSAPSPSRSANTAWPRCCRSAS